MNVYGSDLREGSGGDGSGADGGSPFDADAFLIEQLWRVWINRYKVSLVGPDGETGTQVVAWAEQKRMRLKEDFRFYTDESRTSEAFRIKARTMLELRGRYMVTDANDKAIGALHKQFTQSLVRSTWVIQGPDGADVAMAREKSMSMAVLRRVIDFVPYLDLIPLPYHFEFFLAGSDQPIAEFRRKISFKDRYRLVFSGDPERRLDRRLAIALAVGLDALQSR